MIEIILLVTILIVVLAILYVLKDGINQMIKGIEAMNEKLNEINQKKGA